METNEFIKLSIEQGAVVLDRDILIDILDSRPEGFNTANTYLILQHKENDLSRISSCFFRDNSNLWIVKHHRKRLDLSELKNKNNSVLPKSMRNRLASDYKVTFSKVLLDDCVKIIPLLEKGKVFPIILDSDGTLQQKLPIEVKYESTIDSLSSLEYAISCLTQQLGLENLTFGKLMGAVSSEDWLSGVIRRESPDAPFNEITSVVLWDNHIVLERNNRFKIHPVTSGISAEIYEDGQVTIQHNQNRVSSASHGSVGMNVLSAALNLPTHNKKKSDNRKISLQILGVDWQVQISISPQDLDKCRMLATQINRLSEGKAATSLDKHSGIQQYDIADSILNLVALREQGHLSNEEFDAAKRRLIYPDQ